VNTLHHIIFTCALIFACSLQAIAAEPITLSVPQSVIQQSVSAILPQQVEAKKEFIGGEITIAKLTNLEIGDNSLKGQVSLAGKNIDITTKIGSHKIKVKVGLVELDLAVRGTIRYESDIQTLFFKPLIDNVAVGNAGGNEELGQALAGLFHNREIPITIQQIEPLITESGAKTITINTRIIDISAKPGKIEILLQPEITAR